MDSEGLGGKNIEVYIAFNSIIKESELEKVYKILSKLCKFVDFDALIIQDIAMIDLAKKAGFKKEFHLSTLGNCTFPSGLKTAKQLEFKIGNGICGRSSAVEHDLAKVRVDGSIPFARSRKLQSLITINNCARMVELVDTGDLKSPGYCSCAGSSPAPGTRLGDTV